MAPDSADIDTWFKWYASPERIEARAVAVRALAALYNRRADQLDELLVTRRAQVEAGTWPPAKLRDRSKKARESNGDG